MTICCALHDPIERLTCIGADTRRTSGTFIWPERIEKWVRAGKWRIATAGFGRGRDLLARHAEAIAAILHPDGFPDFLMEMLKNDAWKPDDSKGPIAYENQAFLLASGDGVWMVPAGFGLISGQNSLLAIGAGQDYALGAAHALRDRACPQDIVRSALEAAVAFDAGCGGPLIVEVLH